MRTSSYHGRKCILGLAVKIDKAEQSFFYLHGLS